MHYATYPAGLIYVTEYSRCQQVLQARFTVVVLVNFS